MKIRKSWLWLAGGAALLWLIRKPTQAAPQYEKASFTIPEGKRWRVVLRDGTVTEMTSAQVRNALEAGAVKTLQELPS